MSRPPYLSTLAADPILAKVIRKIGRLPTYYRETTDLKTACRIITGQQLSYQAAATIWARVQATCPSWDPGAVAALHENRLRSCGLSRGKATYIHTAAARVVAGTLDFNAIRRMSDEDAAEALHSIKGFGPWSMEMFLIFALGRPDVFSVGDAGLRRAVCTLYRVPKSQYDRRIVKITDRWRPWRSYASRYLWAWLDS
jgi:DNA-3-methyladenine glycosylase II